MSFVSVSFINYDMHNDLQYNWKIEDTDFITEVKTNLSFSSLAVVKAYKNMGLNAGVALGELIISENGQFTDYIDHFVEMQNAYLHRYIDDWDQVAKERNLYLQILRLIA